MARNVIPHIIEISNRNNQSPHHHSYHTTPLTHGIHITSETTGPNHRLHERKGFPNEWACWHAKWTPNSSTDGNDKIVNILHVFPNCGSSYCTIGWYFIATKTNWWWLQIFNGAGFSWQEGIEWEVSLTFIVGIPHYVCVCVCKTRYALIQCRGIRTVSMAVI
jgi:hypothetical protein